MASPPPLSLLGFSLEALTRKSKFLLMIVSILIRCYTAFFEEGEDSE